MMDKIKRAAIKLSKETISVKFSKSDQLQQRSDLNLIKLPVIRITSAHLIVMLGNSMKDPSNFVMVFPQLIITVPVVFRELAQLVQFDLLEAQVLWLQSEGELVQILRGWAAHSLKVKVVNTSKKAVVGIIIH